MAIRDRVIRHLGGFTQQDVVAMIHANTNVLTRAWEKEKAIRVPVVEARHGVPVPPSLPKLEHVKHDAERLACMMQFEEDLSRNHLLRRP